MRYTEKAWDGNVRHQVGEGKTYAIAWYNESTPSPWIDYTFYGTGAEVWGHWGDAGVEPSSPGGDGAVRLSLRGSLPGTAAGVDHGNGSRPESLILDIGEPVLLARARDLPLDWYALMLEVANGTVSVTHVMVDMWMGGR